MRIPEPRKFAGTEKITPEQFRKRFEQQFIDPLYDDFRPAIKKMADLAWRAHQENHKSPFTSPAGPEFKDPNYQLSDEWKRAKAAVDSAEKQQKDFSGKTRVLVVSGADRNDTTCPGEVSKTRILCEKAKTTLEQSGCDVEVLDLSLITSQYGRTIHPCKGCVSTAMPLCHWPCSCYPNYAVGQVNDWMNEIYPMWVKAHGVLIITPVYWYQAPSALKLMMDRLVCADGGNPDPSSTQGKNAKMAKEIELKGWDYPKHLAGRLFSVLVHGDAAGVDQLRTALVSWLKDMHLLSVNDLSRYIGYLGSYAESHEALENDQDLFVELQNMSLGLAQAIVAARAGLLDALKWEGPEPRPK